VHDAGHGTGLPGRAVRAEGDEPGQDATVNRAYAGLGATFELLLSAYGRDSIDGAGMPLVATVHYDRDYNNAFWNGEQMVFGDGDGGSSSTSPSRSTSSATSWRTASPSTPRTWTTSASPARSTSRCRTSSARSSSSTRSARPPPRPTG